MSRRRLRNRAKRRVSSILKRQLVPEGTWLAHKKRVALSSRQKLWARETMHLSRLEEKYRAVDSVMAVSLRRAREALVARAEL